MERLTEFWKKENKYVSDVTISDYTDDNGLFPISEEGVDKVIQKLGEYEDLEEQGLLKILPCGIGADVYIVPSKVNYELNILSHHEENNRVYHQNVNNITFTSRGWYMECDKDLLYGTGGILVDKFYKETWFLSREEAEQKLKEMESE